MNPTSRRPAAARACAAATAAALCVLLQWTTPAPTPAQDAAAVNLQPQFVTGRGARYSVWTRRDTRITMAGGPQRRELTTAMVVDGEVDWTVTAVHPDGSATCAMRANWMSVTITLPDGSRQVNDSRRATGDTPPMQQLLKAFCSGPVNVEVAADGSVRSVGGTDALRRQAPDAFPEDIDFVESATDLAMVAAAPASARVGQAWSANFDWSHELGTMHHDMRYTLVSVEEIAGVPVANVAGQSRAKLNIDRSKLPNEPPTTARLTSGGTQTQIMFDLLRHEAVGRNTVDSRRIDVQIRLPQITLTRTTDETIHSQALRVAEW